MKFDELNKLTYEQWFGEMELSEGEKERRIEFAYTLEVVYLYIFALIDSYKKLGKEIDQREMVEILERRLTDAIIDYGFSLEKYDLSGYIHNISEYVIKSSLEEEDDEDVESEGLHKLGKNRAQLIAANEANKVYNRVNFFDAKYQRLTKKTWITEKDNKVRYAHTLVDEITIPIEDKFYVGGELMNYPCDDGASPQNIVNCRCVCKYS